MSAKNAKHETARHEAHETDTSTAAPAEERTVALEIAGMSIVLPLKFRPGHVLTENQAKILDAAYQRQFTNNQNANAKARADKHAKASTEAERAATAPQSATDIAALYIDYEPGVGGRAGAAPEDLRSVLALKFWNDLAGRHNKAIAAGQPPLLRKAVPAMLFLRAPAKGKDQSAETHAALLAAYEANKDRTIAALVAHAEYGPQINALVEAEQAARRAEAEMRRAAKGTAGAQTMGADDLI